MLMVVASGSEGSNEVRVDTLQDVDGERRKFDIWPGAPNRTGECLSANSKNCSFPRSYQYQDSAEFS